MQRSLVWLFTVIVFATLTFGNLYTETEGVIPEDAVTKPTVTKQSDRFVEEATEFEEYVYLLFRFGDSVDYTDLKKLESFHHTLRDSGLTVASLATHPNFQHENNTLKSEDFIPDNPESFSAGEWKQVVKKNKSVYGKFFLNEKDSSYAVLAVKMEQGFDEVAAGRRLVEILEGRQISEWEWFFKQDIYPQNPRVIPAGYIMARITMYGAINATNLRYVGIGLVLAFLFLLYFFASWRAATAATGFVLATLASTRGSIGYLQLAGIDTAESVYTTLAYASIIVASVSFHTHAYEGMRHLKQKGQVSGGLLRGFIGQVIRLTALISAFNFLSLLMFDVSVIQDLGLHTALGILLAWILAMHVFPAVADQWINARSQSASQPIRYASNCLLWLCRRLSWRNALTTVGLVLAFAFFGLARGWLPVGSQPLEYIQGTSVYSAVKIMNEDSRPGFVTLDFAFRPHSGNLRSRESIRSFHQFLRQAEKLEGVRQTQSIFDDVRQISREMYRQPIPRTKHEIAFVFQNGIESTDSYWKFQNQLESRNMWRVTVTTTKEGRKLGAVRNRVMQLADRQPYAVYPFGRNALYPDVDQEIIWSKPRNTAVGHLIVIVFVLLWLFYRLFSGYRWLRQAGLSLAGACLASLPFIFASGVLLLFMMWQQIPLDVATTVITALAINASVDFSLYFVHAYRLGVEKGVAEPLGYAFSVEGPAITADMIANSLCFAALVVSVFPPVRQIGIIMVLMLFAAWVGALIIMPPTLHLALDD